MSEKTTCELCGDPMPEGESMFKYHGYSGPCPKPPLPCPAEIDWRARAEKAEVEVARLRDELTAIAANSCEIHCQEAALRARAALKEPSRD